jgi:hypothetical protein
VRDNSRNNWQNAIHAEREAIREALASTQACLDLEIAQYKRSQADLSRECWIGNAATPYEKAHAEREAWRARHARLARLRDEEAACDFDLFEDDDTDDLAA